MPSKKKAKKAKKATTKKAVKPQNKKVPVKAKKTGKTVTFQAKPKADPFSSKADTERSVRHSAPQMKPCICDNPNCHNRQSSQAQKPQAQQPQQIPDFIRQFAEQMGNDMGAQDVMIVSLPLNPANPRTTAPTDVEIMEILRNFLIKKGLSEKFG